MDENFCVYLHRDEFGNVVYVGSGRSNRAYLTCPKSMRGVPYLNFVKENKVTVEIVKQNLSKSDAITEERSLYYHYKDSGHLLNVKEPNNGSIPMSEDILVKLQYDLLSPSSLSWKTNGGVAGTKYKIGDFAGCKDKYGYFVIRLGNKLYKAHRLVFFMHNPLTNIDGLVIDHIDGNRANNNISNLRAVSQSENSRNNTRRPRASNLPTGVLWYEIRKCFQSYVKDPTRQHKNGANKDIQKTFYVSKYESKEKALEAAIEWRSRTLQELNERLELGYTVNHGTKRS